MNRADSQFIEALYREMYDKLYRFANVRLGNHHLAQELVQDVFVLAQEKISDVRSSSNPQGWLMKALSNSLLHALRTKKMILARTVLLDENIAAPPPEPVSEYGLDSFLQPEEWTIISLIYCYGFSIEETAEKMGITYEACRKRLYRTRKKIKETFDY